MVAEIAVSKGISINAKESAYGSTPLHDAVRKNSKAMVKYLINNGADMNAVDDLGRTPLSIAESSNNLEILALLHSKSTTK